MSQVFIRWNQGSRRSLFALGTVLSIQFAFGALYLNLRVGPTNGVDVLCAFIILLAGARLFLHQSRLQLAIVSALLMMVVLAVATSILVALHQGDLDMEALTYGQRLWGRPLLALIAGVTVTCITWRRLAWIGWMALALIVASAGLLALQLVDHLSNLADRRLYAWPDIGWPTMWRDSVFQRTAVGSRYFLLLFPFAILLCPRIWMKIAVFLVTSGVLLLMSSRTALAVFVVIVALCLMYEMRRIVLSTRLLAVVATIIPLGIIAGVKIVPKIQTVVEKSTMSNDLRVQSIREAIGMAIDNPVLGAGMGVASQSITLQPNVERLLLQYVGQSHGSLGIHSLPISWWVDGGVWGLILAGGLYTIVLGATVIAAFSLFFRDQLHDAAAYRPAGFGRKIVAMQFAVMISAAAFLLCSINDVTFGDPMGLFIVGMSLPIAVDTLMFKRSAKLTFAKRARGTACRVAGLDT